MTSVFEEEIIQILMGLKSKKETRKMKLKGIKKSVALLLVVAMVITLLPPLNAKAAQATYTLYFRKYSTTGEECKGDLLVQAGTGDFTTTVGTYENVSQVTLNLTASKTYHLTFTNDEGFYGFWAEQPASDEPDDYVAFQRLYMPVTVNVKYSDGTEASGIKVTTDYAYKGATQNVTTDANGQCVLRLPEGRTQTISVHDGAKWVDQSYYVQDGSDPEITIDKRVEIPVNVTSGGFQITDAKITATGSITGDVVISTDNSLSLLPGETYDITGEHNIEFGESAGYTVNGTTGYKAIAGNSVYLTANINEIDLKYQTSFQHYVYNTNFNNPHGISVGNTLQAVINNRIAGATYTWESTNPESFTVDGNGLITAKKPSYTVEQLKVKGVMGLTEKTASQNIKIPKITAYIWGFDLTEPVPGAVPQSTIPKGINYTGAVSWSPNDARFGYNKTYTATVVLTPDTDYAFIENSVLAQGFNISYNENTGVATLVRRYTTPKAKITSITPPGDVNLTEHSTKEQVIADLPTSVTISAQDGTTSLPIQWSCDSYNTAPEAVNTFKWTANIGSLDADSKATSGTISVTNPKALEVNNDGLNKEITYGSRYEEGFDVSVLFNIDPNAGETTYSLRDMGDMEDIGQASIEDATLTITKAGRFVVVANTAANDIYAEGSAEAILLVNKGIGEAQVIASDIVYGDSTDFVEISSDTNGTDNVTYLYEGVDVNGVSYSSEEAPKNAGEYTVTVTFGETDLYNECVASDTFRIEKKELSANLTGSVEKVYDGTTDVPAENQLEIVLEGIVEADIISAKGKYAYEASNVGTTKVNATELTLEGELSNNYYLASTEASAQVGVITKAIPDIGEVSAENICDTTDFEEIVLKYEKEFSGVIFADEGQELTLGDNEINWTFIPEDTVNYENATGTVNVKVIDTISPTGKLTVGEKAWNGYAEEIEQDVFYNEAQTFSVTGEDSLSGIDGIWYYIASEEKSIDELNVLEDASWVIAGEEFKVEFENNKSFICYVKIADKAGNVTYISSDMLHYDNEPVDIPCDETKEYDSTQKFSIDDENVKSITVNGEEISVDTGHLILPGVPGAVYEIIITDMAGNVSKYVVKMSENATLEETAPDKDEAGDKDKPNGEDTSDKNDSSNGDNEVDGDGLDKMPQTSDNSNVVVWFGAMVFSGIVCVSVKLKKKRA